MTAANIIIDILQPYISVKKGDASLAIQLIEEMSLENIEDYLTDRFLPGTWKGFSHKIPEEVQEILDNLCDILLNPPVADIDGTVKQKVLAADFACHRKYHQIPEQTMQSMKYDAERTELNMSLKID